jgi:hypothetical protein
MPEMALSITSPPVTKAQRRAYARKLREIARQAQRLERQTLQQSLTLLRQVRNRIAGDFAGTDFAQFRIAEQQKQLDDIINSYEAQARALANGSVRQSFSLGEQSVVLPLQEAGINLAWFRPTEAQVDVLAQFTADLIRKVSVDMRADITTSIRLNALGGSTANEAMRDITRIIGLPGRAGNPKGVAYEAERILRTETGRAYNLASFSQQEKLAQDVPDLQKQWIATADKRTRLTHLKAHGQVVDVGKPFKIDGALMMYPLDPKGGPGETINCRCTSITVIPELGPIEAPLDKEIEKELAKRDAEKAKKAGKKKTEPTINPVLKRTLTGAENMIRDLPFERHYSIGTDGQVIFTKDGTNNKIGFTKSEVDKMKGAISTHNHPAGRSFSYSDIRTAKAGQAQEVRAVGKNYLGQNVTYSFKVNDPAFYQLDNNKLKALDDAAKVAARREIDPLVNTGKIKPEEGNYRVTHRGMELLADSLNKDGVIVIYTRR